MFVRNKYKVVIFEISNSNIVGDANIFTLFPAIIIIIGNKVGVDFLISGSKEQYYNSWTMNSRKREHFKLSFVPYRYDTTVERFWFKIPLLTDTETPT